MTVEEKIQFIKEQKEKNYLQICPNIIQSGITLVNNFETLELYENMDINTIKFAEEQIVNLLSNSRDNEEIKKYLDLSFIFCGDYKELEKCEKLSTDLLIDCSEKIVAVYKYVKSTESRSYFIGFEQHETINNYGYIYLNFKLLLDELKKNNIKYNIDVDTQMYNPYSYGEKKFNFIMSYSKEKDNNKEYKLK